MVPMRSFPRLLYLKHVTSMWYGPAWAQFEMQGNEGSPFTTNQEGAHGGLLARAGTLTSTLFFSLPHKKQRVYIAISKPGLVPMNDEDWSLSSPCHVNCHRGPRRVKEHVAIRARQRDSQV